MVELKLQVAASLYTETPASTMFNLKLNNHLIIKCPRERGGGAVKD